YDISRFANFGGKNTIVVRADASRFEGWYYEGAGIYRHVWLEKASSTHIVPDSLFVYTWFTNNVPNSHAEVRVVAALTNTTGSNVMATLTQEIIDPSGKTVASLAHEISMNGREIEMSIGVPSPKLWFPETPRLYKLVSTVEIGSRVVDRVETEFGIRT